MRNKTTNGTGLTSAPTATTKCLNPNCTRPPRFRGLCRACYQTARNITVSGRASWEELEAAGKCLTAHHGGRGKGVREWFLSGLKH